MRRLLIGGLMVVAASGCADERTPSSASASSIASTTVALASVAPAGSSPSITTTSTTESTPTPPTTDERTGTAAPDWLGTRVLDLRSGEDNGVAQPTPPELVDRRLWTNDVLPPPPGDTFVSEIVIPPPGDVISRSSWRPECPVGLDELAYMQVSFFGFDGLFHTGELIVHADHAAGVSDVFGALHDMRFPIEEMVVTTQEAVDAPPTGDSNNTSSFVCRAAVNSGSWSRHAHGGAIDVNPFHNPYVSGDLVIPELAGVYVNRDRDVPGMVPEVIVQLFADIGWGWGGTWSSASDWMHFSDNGR